MYDVWIMEKIGGYFVANFTNARANCVLFFTIHSFNSNSFLLAVFFCLMERPRKWRRKIGSIIVYERQANNVKISSADRPFVVFRFHENSREKKIDFSRKKVIIYT